MDHLARIQRAVDYIEENLKDELLTEAIAREACFSMWHFQKVFSSAVGDTLKDYVRKRRMAQALIELGDRSRRIIDIAIEYGFESQEAFTRSFKSVFGVTPGECRKQGIKSILSQNKPKITIEYLDHLYGGMTMEPKFTVIQEKKVIGLGTKFISILSPEKNNHVVIPRLWDQYLHRAHEIKHRVGRADLGVCNALLDKAKRSHPDECFYMACTEVSEFENVPEGMLTKVIPGGRYAVFTHKGKLEKLEHTMNYIFGSWLSRSGESLRDAPDLEIYDQRFVYGSDTSELDIYIPVK
jgi:AraC family transcriptional regulator